MNTATLTALEIEFSNRRENSNTQQQVSITDGGKLPWVQTGGGVRLNNYITTITAITAQN